jgi:hypothetical protein
MFDRNSDPRVVPRGGLVPAWFYIPAMRRLGTAHPELDGGISAWHEGR